jgi:2-dehydropantoate 2-reductase
VDALVRRPELAALVRERGLTLTDGRGTRRVPVRVVDAPEPGAYAYALLVVPPDQIEAAARAALPALAPGGALVLLANGLVEERVVPSAGAGRVIGAVVTFGASCPARGEAVRTSTGGFVLGRPAGPPDGATERLAALLAPVGPSRLTHDLAAARWAKLAVNCAVSSLGAAGGDRLGALLSHAFVRRLALSVIGEAVAVARAEGVAPERIGPVELGWLGVAPGAAPSWTGLVARDLALRAFGLRYRNLRSSMLAQLERGQTPPVRWLNGEVVVRGAKRGVPVPANAALLAAVEGIARGEARSSLATLRSAAGAIGRAADGASPAG